MDAQFDPKWCHSDTQLLPSQRVFISTLRYEIVEKQKKKKPEKNSFNTIDPTNVPPPISQKNTHSPCIQATFRMLSKTFSCLSTKKPPVQLNQTHQTYI